MLEIRAALPGEMDAVTRLMCIAFDLAYEPTRALLARDPHTNPLLRRVAVKDGRVIACLTIAPRSMWLLQGLVPILGISGVATHPNHRRKGHAARLLESALEYAHRQGFGFAALYAAETGYYERRGWVPVARDCLRTVHREPPSAPRARRLAREATEADMPRIQALHAAFAHGRTGWCLRNEDRWQTIRAYVDHISVVSTPDGAGYALWDTNGGAGFDEIRLMECVVTGTSTAEDLADHIHCIAGSSRIHLSHAVPDDLYSDAPREMTPGSTLLVQLADFGAAVRPLVDIHDSQAPRTALTCLDRPEQGPITLHTPNAREGSSAASLTADSATWCRLLFGAISLEEALRGGNAEGTGNLDWLHQRLTRRSVAIPPVDHF